MKNATFKKAYLKLCRDNLYQLPQGSRSRLYAAFSMLAYGKRPGIKEFVPALQHIYYRLDCCDFEISVILRMLYLYGDTCLLTDEILEELKQAVLDFDYWVSINTKFPGKKNFWTENHMIIHHSSEYLAALLYPDEIFRSRGMKGADILPAARAKIAEWIGVKAKSGFCEWDSNTYMAINIASLLNIYDFSGEALLKTAAKELLDIITFGISVNSYQGIYCCSHGRAYSDEIKDGSLEEIRTIIKMLWNIGEYGGYFFRWPSLMLATSSYETCEAVDGIMLDNSSTYESREQQSFDVEDGPRFDKGFCEEEDLTFYWQNMGYTHKYINSRNKAMGEKYGINVHEEIYTEDRYYRQCEKEGIEPQSCRAVTYMSRVNKLTRKTPHYLLSCAQDYRKGERGFQQHIWQASLGAEAVVFTNHPGTLGERDGRPDLWAGNAVFPRAVQHGSSLICIYNIGDPDVHQFTHAYFPKDKFDEVIETDGWIIGRKNSGYVAIYSQNGYGWSARPGYENIEAVCDSAHNIWVCQLGSRDEYGEFKDFVSMLAQADLRFYCLNVRYTLHEGHLLEVGWEGAPRFCGDEIPVRGYGRFENPFCRSEYMSGKYLITNNNKTLSINLANPLDRRTGLI